ncbi:MAG: SoxAX cytochrome complex subunit [Rhodospirillaceae bacterium]|nr:MAG: SoxAX cytochrome complex subunit [Rhodospirillaceae bacterium]TNC93881.1 MAG: SoxAX cytochrome complex subunit A [Stygiobacter sp.]
MRKMMMAATLVALAASPVAQADPPFDPKDPKMAPYMAGDKRSGYTFAEPETRTMQDDDFTNPGFLWVEDGKKLWSKAEGKVGKSCKDCHGDAEKSMKGVGTVYPRFDPHVNMLLTLEQKINQCRTERMGADPYKFDSKPYNAIATYVKHQSRGMPLAVQTDGPAAPYFDMGRRLYYERRGMSDIACKHCHEDLWGLHMRSELLSQGMPNGFPQYRLKWQTLGSAQKRIRGCFEEVRAEPYPVDSLENTVLEMYATWRANGLRVESPAVRK